MRPFFDDLKRLEKSLVEMADLVRLGIHRSVRCLTEREALYAEQVVRNEALINQLEIQIDDLATTLVARNQPVATDMRLIIAALKINTDLERMGDLAVSITQRALPLVTTKPLVPEISIGSMAASCEGMVERCLEAFVTRDADLAREVLLADDIVDEMRNNIYSDLTGRMERDCGIVRCALGYLFVTRNLERIADHATNIAEDVIFVVRGIDVRHRREMEQ